MAQPEIKVIIGVLDLVSDRTISIRDIGTVGGMEIPGVNSNIWCFEFNESTGKGEIEFQDAKNNNNLKVNSLQELETTIGCTLQSIKDVHASVTNEWEEEEEFDETPT